MLFGQGKIDRALQYNKDKREEREQKITEVYGETTNEVDLSKEVDKKDIFAMTISGLLVFVPVALAVLLVMCLLAYWWMT